MNIRYFTSSLMQKNNRKRLGEQRRYLANFVNFSHSIFVKTSENSKLKFLYQTSIFLFITWIHNPPNLLFVTGFCLMYTATNQQMGSKMVHSEQQCRQKIDIGSSFPPPFGFFHVLIFYKQHSLRLKWEKMRSLNVIYCCFKSIHHHMTNGRLNCLKFVYYH